MGVQPCLSICLRKRVIHDLAGQAFLEKKTSVGPTGMIVESLRRLR